MGKHDQRVAAEAGLSRLPKDKRSKQVGAALLDVPEPERLVSGVSARRDFVLSVEHLGMPRRSCESHQR